MSVTSKLKSDLEEFVKTLAVTSSDDQRKSAYRNLVEKYHPDGKPDEQQDYYNECMIQINMIFASTKTKHNLQNTASISPDGHFEKYWNGLKFEFKNRIGAKILETDWELFGIKLGINAIESAEYSITSRPASYGIDLEALDKAIHYLHFAILSLDQVLRFGSTSNWILEARKYRKRAFDMNTRITKNYMSHVKRSIRIV